LRGSGFEYGHEKWEAGMRKRELRNPILFYQFSDEIEVRLSGDHKIHEGCTDGVFSFLLCDFRIPASEFFAYFIRDLDNDINAIIVKGQYTK
jgi:hypothetical protein